MSPVSGIKKRYVTPLSSEAIPIITYGTTKVLASPIKFILHHRNFIELGSPQSTTEIFLPTMVVAVSRASILVGGVTNRLFVGSSSQVRKNQIKNFFRSGSFEENLLKVVKSGMVKLYVWSNQSM